MTKPTFLVQPQRSNGRGFIPCEIGFATSFAVLRVEKFTRRGKPYKLSRVVGRFPTKTQADGEALSRNKSFEPLPRAYALGRKMLKQ